MSQPPPSQPPPSQPGYYGRPVVKEPVWKPEVALYFCLGGLAGMSGVLGFAARLARRPALARTSILTAFLAVLGCPPLLIADLGRPERFYNMLRIFKPTSPMNLGSWVLTAFGGAIGAAAVSEVTGLLRPLGRLGELGAALFGLPLSTYTAVLVSNSSVPVWHDARRHLPFVFAGSAAASAGAAAAALLPVAESGPARFLAVFGSGLELGAAAAMEHALGAAARHYREGPAAGPARLARGLTAGGAVLMAAGGRRRGLAVAASGLILAGSLAQRLAVLRAGPPSARATAGCETVRATDEELGRPPRAWSRR
jgi:formate-dependent nitrite reductase membrane component NrfD